MTSRERVKNALNHKATDRPPIDLGSTACSGIHAIELKELRKHLKLKDTDPKVTDPMMFIAEVDEDLRQALGVDLVGLYTKGNLLGYRNENYKPWTLPEGTRVLMGGGFQYKDGDDGTVYAYPQGDTSVPPSARMTRAGFYFDNIVRQEDLSSKTVWDGRADYSDQYSVLSDDDLQDLQNQADYLYSNTDYALVGNYWNGGLGDALHLPGAWIKHPKGVRSLTDWMITMIDHPEYIREFFALQTEITMQSMKLYYEAVGNKLEVMVHTGTDFAHQNGLLISAGIYRDLFKPFHRQVNDWIHENTEWKTFMHCCGSVAALLPDVIDAGFDIINPVQVSAKGMDAESLKAEFGDRLVFWGGGCDPQHVLPTATPEEVYAEAKRNAQIFSKNGGFIGGNVHNLQYDVPVENFMAEIDGIKDAGL